MKIPWLALFAVAALPMFAADSVGLTREELFADPLLNFDDLLFVKRVPGTYSHMSDQYYGWWSRPGGGVFVLKNWKSAGLVSLSPQLYGLSTWWTGVRGHGGQMTASAGSVFLHALVCERFDFCAS